MTLRIMCNAVHCQVSLLEIAIKQKIGKLPDLDISIAQLTQLIAEDGFEILSISNAHIEAYNNIPLNNKHRDPFDRLIIATSLQEGIPIISADENFKLYTSNISLIEA